MEEELKDSMTQKLPSMWWGTAERECDVLGTSAPSSPHPATQVGQVRYKRVAPASSHFIPRNAAAKAYLIEKLCRSFCLSLFFREHAPVRSLGITSSIQGEGKSFVALMMARVLAKDSTRPVMLIECDWEHPGVHNYPGYPPTPGLAEWMRGECGEEDIRHIVDDNLTLIRAGEGQQDAVRLLQQITRRGLLKMLAHNDDTLLIELPPVVTTPYSVFAASMAEAVALVVRAGATPDYLVADACSLLNSLPVEGIILNQV